MRGNSTNGRLFGVVIDRSCFDLQEVLQVDPKNYTALLLLAAVYQDTDVPAAVKCLRKAVECSKDPSAAYLGLLKHAPNNEIPAIAEKVLKLAP